MCYALVLLPRKAGPGPVLGVKVSWSREGQGDSCPYYYYYYKASRLYYRIKMSFSITIQ